MKSWGKGRPDYYKPVVSSRPILISTESTQLRMVTQKSFIISAAAYIIDSFYTVPAGYNLNIGGGLISVKDSCINRLRLATPTEELIGDFFYDMQGDLSMTSLTGQELSADTVITAYIYNNDAIESEFSLMVTGVLTKT